MLSRKTFLLGVGAQKAGTTWLANYLSSRSEIFIHPLKEVHFFDSIYRPDLCGYFDGQFSKRLMKRLEKQTYDELLKDDFSSALMYRVLMSRNRGLYQEYFDINLVDEHKLFGEITPSYSLLDKNAFCQIKELYPNIKIIFLMRDPVDRHVSAYKMKCRMSNIKCDLNGSDFIDSFLNANLVERTRYDKLIKNLESVFCGEEIFYGFYESIFSDAEIKRLCQFLGIEFKPGNYQERINSSSRSISLNSRQEEYAKNFYRSVYRFCDKKFNVKSKGIWRL